MFFLPRYGTRFLIPQKSIEDRVSDYYPISRISGNSNNSYIKPGCRYYFVIGLLLFLTTVSAEEILIQGQTSTNKAAFDQFQEDFKAQVIWKSPSNNAQVWALENNQANAAIDEFGSRFDTEFQAAMFLNGDYRNVLTSVETDSISDVEMTDKLDRIRTLPSTKTLSIARIQNSILLNHALQVGYGRDQGFNQPGSIKLPINNISETAVQSKNLSQKTPTGYAWVGQLIDSTGKRDLNSNVILLMNGDTITGTVHKGGSLFSIRPLNNGLHAIIEKDLKMLPPDHHKRKIPVDKIVNPININQQENSNRDTLSIVDLLVFYTDLVAANYVNTRRDLIELALHETNTSLVASNIGNIKFRISGTHKLSYDESGSWEEHLDWFAEKGDGQMDEVHTLLDQSGADIALLIISDLEACGEARRIHARAENAFAIVNDSCATGYYSFGHEIGHLFGARHDRNVDSSNVPYPHGHGHLNGNWRTIMGYSDGCNGCERILRWSNPANDYQGETTGVTGKEDNARVIRDEAYRISQFRSN